ncbi:MAG: NRDE family protein [Bacteroidetes bacterium]|nr:NRDE family protein [Bacteroidota bacterium]
MAHGWALTKPTICALTNYRDLNNINTNAPLKRPFGEQFLKGKLHTDEMHQLLKTQGRLYNGFNLIYGDVSALFYYSNVTDQVRQLYPAFMASAMPCLTRHGRKWSTVRLHLNNSLKEPLNPLLLSKY